MRILWVLFVLSMLMLSACWELSTPLKSPYSKSPRSNPQPQPQAPPEENITVIDLGMETYSPKRLVSIFCDFSHDFECVEAERTDDTVNFVIKRTKQSLFKMAEVINIEGVNIDMTFGDSNGANTCLEPVLLSGESEIGVDDTYFAKDRYRKFILTCADPQPEGIKSMFTRLEFTILQNSTNQTTSVTGQVKFSFT